MGSNVWYVITGFALLTVIALGFVALITFLFYKYIVKKTLKVKEFWLPVAILTVAWLLATTLSVMFATDYGLLTFSLCITALLFLSGYLIAWKILKLELRERLYYTVMFSGIINPIWYFLF